MPEVVLAPLQPPEAVQVLALVLDHVSVEEPLYGTDVLLALNVMVGAGGAAATVMVTA